MKEVQLLDAEIVQPERLYFLPQAGYLRPDLSASDDIVAVLGETDRSALAKARACASDQNSFLAHTLNSQKIKLAESIGFKGDFRQREHLLRIHD